MEKVIQKTRKDHTCCFCNKVIDKGSKALYVEGKSPKYEETDKPFEEKQTGIEYYKLYYCWDGNTIPSCNEN